MQPTNDGLTKADLVEEVAELEAAAQSAAAPVVEAPAESDEAS